MIDGPENAVATTTKRIFLHTVPCQHPKTLMMNIVELIKKALRFGQTPPVYPTCCKPLQHRINPGKQHTQEQQLRSVVLDGKNSILPAAACSSSSVPPGCTNTKINRRPLQTCLHHSISRILFPQHASF